MTLKEEETIYCKTIDSGVYEYLSFDDDFRLCRKPRQKDYVDVYLEEHLAMAEKLNEKGGIK